MCQPKIKFGKKKKRRERGQNKEIQKIKCKHLSVQPTPSPHHINPLPAARTTSITLYLLQYRYTKSLRSLMAYEAMPPRTQAVVH